MKTLIIVSHPEIDNSYTNNFSNGGLNWKMSPGMNWRSINR
ncbi:NAD(P)H-dependent oxidoreductase [Secundilactobacillus oryzae]|nr:NAD(P)H-dependent oxidoreductase [Secundilactobacillus oryzae]